jgi:hypothetical protein
MVLSSPDSVRAGGDSLQLQTRAARGKGATK